MKGRRISNMRWEPRNEKTQPSHSCHFATHGWLKMENKRKPSRRGRRQANLAVCALLPVAYCSNYCVCSEGITVGIYWGPLWSVSSPSPVSGTYNSACLFQKHIQNLKIKCRTNAKWHHCSEWQLGAYWSHDPMKWGCNLPLSFQWQDQCTQLRALLTLAGIK